MFKERQQKDCFSSSQPQQTASEGMDQGACPPHCDLTRTRGTVAATLA